VKYKSNSVLVPGVGDPCPRCGQPMQIYRHGELNDRQKRAPFVFGKWFRCGNVGCKTVVVTRPQDRIWNADLSTEDRRNLEEWLSKKVATKRTA
jgi:hypothetical protein